MDARTEILLVDDLEVLAEVLAQHLACGVGDRVGHLREPLHFRRHRHPLRRICSWDGTRSSDRASLLHGCRPQEGTGINVEGREGERGRVKVKARRAETDMGRGGEDEGGLGSGGERAVGLRGQHRSQWGLKRGEGETESEK